MFPSLLAPLLGLSLLGELQDQALHNGEAWLGTPWVWNGRGTASNPGMGCMSLVFLSWGPATGTPTSAYSVNPSELVASGRLGSTLAVWPRGMESLAVQNLEKGDVLYFLLAEQEIPDAPLWVEGELRYWPWHMGLYAGEGEVLHAEPGGVVRRQALAEIAWDRLLVTRPR